jgi:hypothetical protein
MWEYRASDRQATGAGDSAIRVHAKGKGAAKSKLRGGGRRPKAEPPTDTGHGTPTRSSINQAACKLLTIAGYGRNWWNIRNEIVREAM